MSRTTTSDVNTTTIADLIAALQRVADDYGDETPVLVANQPAFSPMAHVVKGLTVIQDDGDTGTGEPGVAWIGVDQPDSWLDNVNPYAPAEAHGNDYL